MSNIKVSDLQATGSELFSDSESYMQEISDEEILLAKGGTGTPCQLSGTFCKRAVVFVTKEVVLEAGEAVYEFIKDTGDEIEKVWDTYKFFAGLS